VLSDGATIVADDWADLTDGDIQTAISLDGQGVLVTGESLVWTNVEAVGAGIESTNHCSDWTSDSSGLGGRRGDRTSTSSSWTQVGTGSLCNVDLRLYCIQQ
jgi:hypothetical protein